jgi:hypothetical protein
MYLLVILKSMIWEQEACDNNQSTLNHVKNTTTYAFKILLTDTNWKPESNQ